MIRDRTGEPEDEPVRILDRYILRKHVGPFAFATTTIAFLFAMRVLIDLLHLFASRNLGFLTILETFALSLGWILAMTFPMAVLVAVVMTFGRLAQDFELDAIHAGGVSFLRVLVPVLLAAAVLTVLLVFFYNRVLPDANHRLKNLTADIHKMRPTIAIRERVFMDDFEGYRVLVREVEEEEDIIRDVTIYTLDPREPTRTIHAPWGELVYEDDGNRLVIRLHDGEIHEVDREDASLYFLMEFETHELIFDDLGTKLERREGGSSRGDRELSAGAMRERIATLAVEKATQADSLEAITSRSLAGMRRGIRSLVASEDSVTLSPAEFTTRARVLMRKIQNAERRLAGKQRDINRYSVEIHKKYSFPVACIVFVLLGAPLGVRMRRGGIGVGAAMSFLFFIVYYLATLGGEKLGDRGIIPASLGMWSINVILGLIGILLVLRRDSRLHLGSRNDR
jgi:lipopolysaccharide export system permease protein